MAISVEDDLFHDPGNDPYWNESAWFGFNIPERQISGWVYFYHRPNMKYSIGGLALWDPTGQNTYDCLYYNVGDTVELPGGAEMFDFELASGLSVECAKPLHEYRLSYEANDCAAELTWTGIMNAHDTGLPAGSEEWGTGHYDQSGRMVGTITIAGERYEVDGWSQRDHSWGPRRYRTNPRSDFPWAIASPDSAFQLFAISDLPIDDDPVEGTTERVITGWYLRDGEVGSLVSGTRRAVERAPDGRPLRVELRAEDSLGRTLEAEGRCVNWLHWHGYQMYQWWSLAQWSFDGRRAWGEEQDLYPFHHSRRFIRSRLGTPDTLTGGSR
jgi:hypothetical protein